jgi:hypothetical protein
MDKTCYQKQRRRHKSGRLIYDENGAAAGDRTLVAVLRGAPNLSVDDILIV